MEQQQQQQDEKQQQQQQDEKQQQQQQQQQGRNEECVKMLQNFVQYLLQYKTNIDNGDFDIAYAFQLAHDTIQFSNALSRIEQQQHTTTTTRRRKRRRKIQINILIHLKLN
eukprot:UN09617